MRQEKIDPDFVRGLSFFSPDLLHTFEYPSTRTQVLEWCLAQSPRCMHGTTLLSWWPWSKYHRILRLKVKEVGGIGLRSAIGVTPSYPSLSICLAALFRRPSCFILFLRSFFLPPPALYRPRYPILFLQSLSLPIARFSSALPTALASFPVYIHIYTIYTYILLSFAASSSRSHHASSFDSGSMECYTILGSEGRTEPVTEKWEGRIGEDGEKKRERESM